MRRLTAEEFDKRFPRRHPLRTVEAATSSLTVERDTVLTGVVDGDVAIERGMQLVLAESRDHAQDAMTAATIAISVSTI